MAKFLLHLRPDGKPMGVYSADAEHYDESLSAEEVERHVRLVRDTKAPLVTWGEWADRLARRAVPSHRLWRFDILPHRASSLTRVLADAQDAWRRID